jgi:hypothetical protein
MMAGRAHAELQPFAIAAGVAVIIAETVILADEGVGRLVVACGDGHALRVQQEQGGSPAFGGNGIEPLVQMGDGAGQMAERGNDVAVGHQRFGQHAKPVDFPADQRRAQAGIGKGLAMDLGHGGLLSPSRGLPGGQRDETQNAAENRHHAMTLARGVKQAARHEGCAEICTACPSCV